MFLKYAYVKYIITMTFIFVVLFQLELNSLFSGIHRLLYLGSVLG